MNEKIRQSRSIRIIPDILKQAHYSAIQSDKKLGEWIEEAIEEKIKKEQKGLN